MEPAAAAAAVVVSAFFAAAAFFVALLLLPLLPLPLVLLPRLRSLLLPLALPLVALAGVESDMSLPLLSLCISPFSTITCVGWFLTFGESKSESGGGSGGVAGLGRILDVVVIIDGEEEEDDDG